MLAGFSDESKVLTTLSNMKEVVEEIEDAINSNMKEQDITYLVDKLKNQANEIKNNYR